MKKIVLFHVIDKVGSTHANMSLLEFRTNEKISIFFVYFWYFILS